MQELWDKIREKRPLIHFITNYVTVNDCANITLAAGGSPVMADELKEIPQITSLASALVLNLGTLNERTVRSMLEAGRVANEAKIPVILDPVGAGATAFRTDTAAMLLEKVRFAVIKGNISEISALTGKPGETRGVDAQAAALSSENNLAEHVCLARELAARTEAVTVISGPVDVIASTQEVWRVENGHPMMADITGTGCMSAAVLAVCVGAFPDKILSSAVMAVTAMGICGELAYGQIEKTGGGTGSYRMFLIDAMSRMHSSLLEKRGLAEQLSLD